MLPRRQQPGFPKTGQHGGGLFYAQPPVQFGVGGGEVDLYHVLPRVPAAGVGHPDGEPHLVLRCRKGADLLAEGGVGQAVPEGVEYAAAAVVKVGQRPLGTGGLVIAVAQVHPLLILPERGAGHVLPAVGGHQGGEGVLVKEAVAAVVLVGKGGVALEAGRPGVGQAAGGVHPPGQDIPQGEVACAPRAPQPQDGGHAGIVLPHGYFHGGGAGQNHHHGGAGLLGVGHRVQLGGGGGQHVGRPVVVGGGGRVLVFPTLPADEYNAYRPGAGLLRPLVHRRGELIQGLARGWVFDGAANGGLTVVRR